MYKLFNFQNKRDAIVIPPIIHTKTRTSCDCPSSNYLTRIYDSNDKKVFKNTKTITLYNAQHITLQPKECQTIFFEETILTSLPALCFVYGDEFLSFKKLSFIPNFIRSNDGYLNVTIVNQSNNICNHKPFDLVFYCLIIFPNENI
jgi:hypothetical protein